MEHIPQPGEIYQHFKGNLYRIVTLAKHTETEEAMVVYQALYGNFEVWVRPLSMFMEKLDQEKYRFTLVPSVAGVSPAVTQPQSESVKEAVQESEKASEKTLEEEAAELNLHPLVLKFLEADGYEEKLDILASMHSCITESMLNTVAISLDMEVSGEDLEADYQSVKNGLLMLVKYECSRLR